MDTAVISNQGQIILPEQVRSSLQLKVGDSVGFIFLENGMVVMQPISRKARQVFGLLHQSDQEPISVEDMNVAIADAKQNEI